MGKYNGSSVILLVLVSSAILVIFCPVETQSARIPSKELTPEDFSPDRKCSVGGFPCTPVIKKPKSNNNSSESFEDESNDDEFETTTMLSHGRIPCCSGKCLYQPGWIDAVCE